MRPGVAADGREELWVFPTQTDEHVKSSSIMEGGFSLQSIRRIRVNVPTYDSRLYSRIPAGLYICSLLFMGPRHAWHTLLFPSGKWPGCSINQQIEQGLVLQIGLISLQ